MIKEKITAEVVRNHNVSFINFYLDYSKGSHIYIFSREFSKGVYNYFRDGVSMNQILSFSDWNHHNVKLNKTIERLPKLVRYAKQEHEEWLLHENDNEVIDFLYAS